MDGLEGLGLLLASNCVAEDKEVILQRTSDLRFTLSLFLSFSFFSLFWYDNRHICEKLYFILSNRACPLFGGLYVLRDPKVCPNFSIAGLIESVLLLEILYYTYTPFSHFSHTFSLFLYTYIYIHIIYTSSYYSSVISRTELYGTPSTQQGWRDRVSWRSLSSLSENLRMPTASCGRG